MLEQYRKDFPAEEKDLLPDSESSIGKRKLLFILSGAVMALAFFLFLMGMFRSDEDSLAVKDGRSDIATKESVLALEEKLQTMTSRLEKLEQMQLAQAQPVHTAVYTDLAKAQPTQATTNDQIPNNQITAQAPLQSAEEAIAMTNQALHQFINKEVAAHTPAPVVVTAPKKTAVVAKAKKVKEKVQLAVSPQSPLYIVQKGDTLSKISQRYFGTPNRWKAIYDANRDRIANINQLKVGTKIVIPQEAKQ